jgi:hypothetical protein
MKKRFTIILASLGLIAAGLISLGQISFVSATACVTESSQYESGGISYTVLQFKTIGTCQWAVPERVVSVDYLIVAGGGGGSGRHAGGGGAGGVIEGTASNLSGTYTIVVGAGGRGSPQLTSDTTETRSEKGGNSSVSGNNISITSTGGGAGRGRGNPVSVDDLSGGSGGGSDCASCTPGTGIAGQGFSGGQGVGGEGLTYSGGGGGGAGEAGKAATSGIGGNGGAGKSSSISGVSVTYAGGGGGATFGTSAGSGGLGGGGNGGNGAVVGSNATGFGSGGGGGGHNDSVWAYQGGNGSSGIVIVRYITPPIITDTNGIVMLVDPRSESVPIPYLTVTSGAPTRVCFDLKSSNDDLLTLKTFSNANSDSDKFRMAVTFGDVTVGTDAKITASRTNTAALLKRDVSNSESYLKLYRPAGGWSEVDSGKVKVRVDYAVDLDCSEVSGTEINVEIPIKVIEIGAIQKNPVDLSRG